MRLLLTILWAGLTVAYPLVVYVGLQQWPPHVLGLVLLGLLGTLLGLRRLLRDRSIAGSPVGSSAGSVGGAKWPLLAMGLLLLGTVLRQGAFIKAVPVLVSGGLLAMFALSLRGGGQSFVERLARRQDPELSPAKVRYCRQVTVVWCWFFVLNIAITLGLAVAAPLSWWTLYTGLIAYVLIGGLFTVEYVVRKAKFRDYGTWWHDRALALVFPPQGPAGGPVGGPASDPLARGSDA